jgi:hypothetical protein
VPGANIVGSPVDLLKGETAMSTSDVWAVGDYYCSNGYPSRTLIEHWDGTQWSVVPSPCAIAMREEASPRSVRYAAC